MQIGLIGLGKMGFQLALNMKQNGFFVLATDAMEKARQTAREASIDVVDSIESLVQSLGKPRTIWMMVPSGKIVESVIDRLKGLLEQGDVLIDGGNSMYLDTLRRYEALKTQGISFVDCGTSGGVDGARNGACLMVGGDKNVVQTLEPLFQAIAKKDGYAHVGEAGSGHYVKMVHNGIEYGMMQAIGEGFDLLKASRFDLDYRQIASVWSNGSIIEGLLMRNVRDAFSKDETLDNIEGKVDDSGEGQWMIEEALKNKVALPVIAASLFARYKSKDDGKFAEKVVAAMRNEFGGHAVYKK